jgi:hypothetical protein
MKELKRCPHCESTIDLPHDTDEYCFRAVNREMAAAITVLRDVTKRKGKLLRDRIRVRQAAGVRGRSRYGRPPSPLSVRRFSRFK